MTRTAKCRFGFTIAEIIIAVAIVAILAAIAFPLVNAGQQTDSDRARAAAKALRDLRESVAGFEPTLPPTSFKQNIGQYPLRLSDLTNRISSVSGASNSLNSCSQLYLAANVTAWSARGPYWGTIVSVNGATLAPGFVAQDLLVVTKVNPAGFTALTDMSQYLAVRMPSVTLSDAQNLALAVDGNITGVGGTVRFTAAGSAAIPVDYIIVGNGC